MKDSEWVKFQKKAVNTIWLKFAPQIKVIVLKQIFPKQLWVFLIIFLLMWVQWVFKPIQPEKSISRIIAENNYPLSMMGHRRPTKLCPRMSNKIGYNKLLLVDTVTKAQAKLKNTETDFTQLLR
jgi:hypothetical protein